jgi:hypothetical protein
MREKKIRRIGFEYYVSGDYKQVIGAYTLYMKTYSGSSGAFESLGEMFMLDGSKLEARKNIEKPLSLNPDNADAKKILDKLNSP